MSTLPLVSCIMPTKNRREFVPQAIAYFLRQTYPNKELVILNDGEPVRDLVVPNDAPIRFVPEGAPIRLREFSLRFSTLGTKRNACVAEARGDLIAHWDDDDWYGPERLECQVTAMQAQRAEVCGLDSPLFYDLRTGKAYRYHCSDRPYIYSATLMYTRAYWQASPFPDLQVGASTPFVWGPGRLDHAAILRGADNSGWYVGMAHDGNTSPKDWNRAEYFRPEIDLPPALGSDWPFYQSLRASMGVAA